MKILYGVVGEGMGHATRSRVVIEHLLGSGHEVRVVVSGRAHAFLVERLAQYPRASIEQIEGLTLSYFDNKIDKSESFFANLKKAPKAIRKNVEVYRRVAESGFSPELVISDFESWAALYGLNHRLPVISIDNMQIINRCQHDEAIVGPHRGDFRLARYAVKAKMPGAYHYLVTTFFCPPVRKKRTTLVPPILRPEIQAAVREPGAHVLVYQTAATNSELLPVLAQLPYEFRVYGMGQEGSQGNVTLRAFSETGFVDDLRTARAVIAGGGFSLMSEAVSLRVPMLSLPIAGQFEQELNARWLAHLGYGDLAQQLDADVVEGFLARTDRFEEALAGYVRHDDQVLFGCLEELLERAAHGDRRPKRLDAPALGKWGDAGG